MPRNIAAEIIEGLEDAADHLDGKPSGVRTTKVNVPARVDVREIREAIGVTQAEFAARFAVPVDTLRKWERGTREPGAVGRAFLAMIKRDHKRVEELLSTA